MGLRPRNLTEYLLLLWHRKSLISLVTLGVIVATWWAINRLPNLYESRALIVLSGLQNEEGRQAAAAQVTLVTQQLNSRAVLDPLLERHQLYPNFPRDFQFLRFKQALKLDTKFRNYSPEIPEAVEVTFRHTDAAQAQRVLSDVVALFDHTNSEVSQQAAAELREISAKIGEVESQLRQLGARRAATGGSGPSVDWNALRAQRMAAASSVESLEDRQFTLERQIAAQREQISEQEKLAKATTVAAPSGQSGAHGALYVRRAELEAQLKDYATQYTDKNPKVVQARAQLAEINRQLSQLDSAAGGQAPATLTPEGRELRAMQRELARLETEQEVTRRELNRRKQTLDVLPKVSTGTGLSDFINPALLRSGGGESANNSILEAGYLQTRYAALLSRQDELQRVLQKPLERGLAPFWVLDKPSLPQLPIGPNRAKLKMMSLFIALLVGLGVAIALEVPRLLLLRDERDVAFYLNAPVVALLPETLTPSERGNRRRALFTRRLGYLLLALAAMPALALLIQRLEIMHMIAFR
jgi:polysaccharide biosynthesis transport protein